jgi:hypothetical protein
MHTGDELDLAGLRGEVEGNELEFPTEGVIFSIAAAFFLSSPASTSAWRSGLMKKSE